MLAMLCGTMVPGMTSAHQATNEGSLTRIYPRAVSYDLPAMMLKADEFPVSGLAQLRGRLIGPEQQAAVLVDTLGLDPEDAIEQLDEYRWRGAYLGEFGIPSKVNDGQVSVNAQSYVTEYRDEEGASAGFALLETETDGSEDIDAPAVGDESELTLSEGVASDSGLPYERLDYTFRSGEFVGGIAIHWFEGPGSVSPEEMAASAEILMDRIDSVVADDNLGLFGKTLRLNPGEAFTTIQNEEQYFMFEGKVPRLYGEDVQVASSTNMFWKASGMVGMYNNYIYVAPVNGSSDEGAVVILRVYEMESAREARTFVDAALERTLEQSATDGYSSMEPLETIPGLAGTHSGVTYTWPIGDGVESQGYRLWLQNDTYVVSIESDHPDGIDLDVVTRVLEEQAECVTSERFRRPMEVPEDLIG